MLAIMYPKRIGVLLVLFMKEGEIDYEAKRVDEFLFVIANDFCFSRILERPAGFCC